MTDVGCTGRSIRDSEADTTMKPRLPSGCNSKDKQAIKEWVSGLRRRLTKQKSPINGHPSRTVCLSDAVPTSTHRKLRKKIATTPKSCPDVLSAPTGPSMIPRDQVLEAMDQYQRQDQHGRYDHGRLMTQAPHLQQSPAPEDEIRFYPELRKQSRQSSVSTVPSAPAAHQAATHTAKPVPAVQEHLQRSVVCVERMFTSKIEQPSPTDSNWTGTTLSTWQGKDDGALGEVGPHDELVPGGLQRKGKAKDLRALAMQEDVFTGRLRRYSPLPDCMIYSPLDDTLDYKRPFHCALCYKPLSTDDRHHSLSLDETPNTSSSSVSIQQGRPVNIIAQNVYGSITSVTRNAIRKRSITPITSPAPTQQTSFHTSPCTTPRHHSPISSSNCSTIVRVDRDAATHNSVGTVRVTRLQRAVSVPPLIRCVSPPPPPVPELPHVAAAVASSIGIHLAGMDSVHYSPRRASG